MPIAIQDFAKRIREKHDEYDNLDDEELTLRVLAKFPEYQDIVEIPDELQEREVAAQQQFQPEPTEEPQEVQETRSTFGRTDRIIDVQRPTVTQKFGNRHPREMFSGGVNTGTDFRAREGTTVKLPPGEWDILKTYKRARRRGFIGDFTNEGYGNSVTARNVDTGEILRFSHLKNVNVDKGDTLDGGLTIGRTGTTGNSTGPHLDIEYRDENNRLRDIMRSPYSLYLQ